MDLLLMFCWPPVNLSMEISSLRSVLLIVLFKLSALLMRSKAAMLPCHCREELTPDELLERC